jgi:hypothetical protein
MHIRRTAFLFTLFILMAMPGARAQLRNHDAYVGYSRLGANTFNSDTGGLNGWNAALHIHLMPFVGAEADVSYYGLGADASTAKTTNVMLGPRVTLKALGFAVFAHGLAGVEHSSTSAGVHFSDSTGTYAAGGGVDVPIFPFFAWRIAADHVSRISNAPAGSSQARFNTGLVFRF